MKKILLLTFALATLLSSFASADVTLQLAKNIKVLATNGEVATQTGSIQLPNGTNQLALRYVGSIGKGMDADPVQSEVIVIAFEASNQKLRMNIPTIKKESQLKQFNRSPQISISDQSGTKLKVRTDILKKNGIQVFRDFERELEKYNKGAAPAAIAPVAKTVIPATGSVAAPQGTADAAKMLMYWYQQADPATREMFKAWISQQ